MPGSPSRSFFLFIMIGCLCATIGCDKKRVSYGPTPYPEYGGAITFKDDTESNAEPTDDVFDLQFTDLHGDSVTLEQFRGKKNVVLVVTRGFNGSFCPYCTAQTSRLIRNHDAFEERNAEVIVVYPGEPGKATEFSERVTAELAGGNKEIPFSIVLDEDLLVVDKLMIRGDLAKPATYILDKEGGIRFAYVGRTLSDRPSMKAMLAQLDRIEQQ